MEKRDLVKKVIEVLKGHNSEVYLVLGFNKIMDDLETAITSKEVKEIYQNASMGGEVKKRAKEKLRMLIVKELKTATTLEEFRSIYRSVLALDDNEIEKGVEKKLCAILTQKFKTATTYKEFEEIHNNAPLFSQIREKATRKKYFLFTQELETATTIEEVSKLFKIATEQSPESCACIKKLAELIEKEDNK